MLNLNGNLARPTSGGKRVRHTVSCVVAELFTKTTGMWFWKEKVHLMRLQMHDDAFETFCQTIQEGTSDGNGRCMPIWDSQRFITVELHQDDDYQPGDEVEVSYSTAPFTDNYLDHQLVGGPPIQWHGIKKKDTLSTPLPLAVV